jgi:hypothetical protein
MVKFEHIVKFDYMVKFDLVLLPFALQDFRPPIHLSESDFTSITANGSFCDERGRLGPAEFSRVMKKQARAPITPDLHLIYT